MKKILWFLLATILFGVVMLGCSDGKLNLLLVFRTESDPEEVPFELPEFPSSSSEAEYEPPPSEPISSSSEISSSSYIEESSSSEGEEEIEVEPSSSSSEEGRGIRSSTSKTDSEGNTYEDYPDLQPGAPGVEKAGLVTRYWDGCKPTCSWMGNVADQQPSWATSWTIGRQCDINSNDMPLFYLGNDQWYTDYNNIDIHIGQNWYATPSACSNDHRVTDWPQSPTYTDWKENYYTNANYDKYSSFPNTDTTRRGHACFDQIPYAVNDTLAYAFAAGGPGRCGECFLLQFDGNWENGELAARPTHRALKGKKLVVITNNTGVGDGSFDLMIPGGGLGDYDGFSWQIGLTEQELGQRTGGLLSECLFGDPTLPFSAIGGGLLHNGWDAPLEDFQDCLRAKCNRAFGNKDPNLLKGCLWHVEWFMAADNPRTYYIPIECPKYLKDRYAAKQPYSDPPKWPKNEDGSYADFCVIDGTPCPK